MSHVATGKLRVTNLDELAQAASALGMELMVGQKTFKWYGRYLADSEEGRTLDAKYPASQWGRCEHALRVIGGDRDAYEVGVIPAIDGQGGYDLIFDGWGTGGRAITSRCGARLERLAEEVGALAATRMLARKGYAVRRETINGHINLVAMKR